MKITTRPRALALPVALVAASLLAQPATSRATLLAYDSFDTYTKDVALKDNTLNDGTGWLAAWGSGGGTVNISDKALTWTLDNFTYGGGASVAVSGANNSSAIRRDLASSVTNGSDIYVSMLFQVVQENGAAGTLVSGHYAGWSPRDGTFASGEDNTLTLGTGSSSGTWAGARVNNNNSTVKTALQYNTTYLVVVRFSGWDGTSYKTTTTWLNPSSGDLASANDSIVATITASAGGSTSFNGLQLRTNSLGTDTYYFDDIRIGTNWNDVVLTQIPESATSATLSALGVSGIVLAAMITRRRFL
ncbi:MAG: cell wall anchor protein, partial [Opitutaceae bacterium]|nr:cell wall anchor protein [Opitutaceae bacterium]